MKTHKKQELSLPYKDFQSFDVLGVTSGGRTGILNMVARHLHAEPLSENFKAYKLVKRTIYLTHTCSNQVLFSVWWEEMFQYMEATDAVQGPKAVSSLKRHHFSQVLLLGDIF